MAEKGMEKKKAISGGDDWQVQNQSSHKPAVVN